MTELKTMSMLDMVRQINRENHFVAAAALKACGYRPKTAIVMIPFAV